MPPDPIFWRIWNLPLRISRPMNGSGGAMGLDASGTTPQVESSWSSMWMRSALLEVAGFRHAFAARSEDADAIARTLGVSRVYQVKQVHGGRAIDASEAIETNQQEADAVVSRSTDRPWAVGVRVADCVPVLVA